MLAVCPGCGGGGVGRHARSPPHGVTRRRRRAGPARCRRCSVHESRPSPPAGPMPTPRMCANAPAPRAWSWRSGGAALAAGPPSSANRQAGLLPLLDARPVPPGTLVRVAERRLTIEERFQTGKALSA